MPASCSLLLEETWLVVIFVRITKVAQTNTDEPISLLGIKLDPLPQVQRNFHQLFAG